MQDLSLFFAFTAFNNASDVYEILSQMRFKVLMNRCNPVFSELGKFHKGKERL